MAQLDAEASLCLFYSLLDTYFPFEDGQKGGFDAIVPNSNHLIRKGSKQLLYTSDQILIANLKGPDQNYLDEGSRPAFFKFTSNKYSGLFLGHQFCTRNATVANIKERASRERQETKEASPLCRFCREKLPNDIGVNPPNYYGKEIDPAIQLCQSCFSSVFLQARCSVAICTRCGGAKEVLKGEIEHGNGGADAKVRLCLYLFELILNTRE